MSDGPRSAAGLPDDEPFEATLEALEAVVTRLESGQLGLEEALAAFEEGVRLARRCEARLDRVERRLEVLLRGPDGGVRIEPFVPGRGGSGDEGGE